jgi:hypothetical protein
MPGSEIGRRHPCHFLRMARICKANMPAEAVRSAPSESPAQAKPKRTWLSLYNEALWTRIY